MSRGHFAFALIFAVMTAAGAAATAWPTPVSDAPAVTAVSQQDPGVCSEPGGQTSDASDPARVKPGCCTSNCNKDRDCDRICGKGNCVCIVESDCCRRCTW